MAAIETAMTWGLRAGWERCVVEARRGQPEALAWVGMLGGEEEMGLLLEAVQRPETRHAALRALGYSGRKVAVEECLKWLADEDERTAKLAAEAFGMVTGVDAYTEGFARAACDDEADEDDLTTDLSPVAEDALVTPEPHAFSWWWQAHGERFDAAQRYLRGKPRRGRDVDAHLCSGAMRGRQAIALEAHVRSGGAATTPRAALREGLAGLCAEALEGVDFQRRRL